MNTKRYIDVIDRLICRYNHTWHWSIKMEPIAVTKENQGDVWQTLHGSSPQLTIQKRYFLKVGDTVRISKEKMRFEKSYEQNWTREIFKIEEIIPRSPLVFKLMDLARERIRESFYVQELQKITDLGYYIVEKVLRTRKRKGNMEYLVKFQGYAEKVNAWVHDVKII